MAPCWVAPSTSLPRTSAETQGTVTLYPNAPGFLNGVNDNGQFVGTTFDGQKNFIYDAKTGAVTNISDGNSSFLKAINDNGAVLELTRNGTFQLSGINDIGEVVGSFSDVPEPSSLVSLLVGIAALALAALQRRLA